jgi:predicted nucleic acid-binding protein
LLPLRETHYALANDWMDSFVTALRTLDALHLSLAHAGGLPLITADRTLARAGKQLGTKIKVL